MIEYQGENYTDVIGKQGLVAVQYYATWCGPCKMLKPVLDAVAQDEKDVDFYRVDIDQYRDQAIQSGIRSVQTVVLYKDGEEVDRTSGYQPKDKIAQWIGNHK